MLLTDKCHHGKTYKEECYKCEIIWLRNSFSWMEPKVMKMKLRLKELENIERPVEEV